MNILRNASFSLLSNPTLRHPCTSRQQMQILHEYYKIVFKSTSFGVLINGCSIKGVWRVETIPTVEGAEIEGRHYFEMPESFSYGQFIYFKESQLQQRQFLFGFKKYIGKNLRCCFTTKPIVVGQEASNNAQTKKHVRKKEQKFKRRVDVASSFLRRATELFGELRTAYEES